MGISVITLLTLLIFTSPAQAVDVADFAGHNFAEEYFAIEVDLVGDGTSVFDPDPENPDLINDLIGTATPTGDSNPLEDEQFYLAYMNMSGIETAFSALEKFEHTITLQDLLTDDVYTTIDTLGTPDMKTAINTPISHINATAPFQQLVQHYTTSEEHGFKDVFVTNNFMALIAYETGTGDDPNIMDKNDRLYIGYTFCLQNLTDAINDIIAPTYELGHFDYEADFETTATGFEFGITYTNLFVLWQAIDIAPKGVDVTGAGEQYIRDDTNGIIYGGHIAAASVLDYLAFNYVFETTEFTGANRYIEGTVTTHYDIGETNFLVTRDNAAYIADHADNWTHNPFTETPTYTLDIPDAIADANLGLLGLPDIPSSVTISLPELAFYFDDDAKTRIKMHGGFGLTVATATTTFGVDVVEPEYELVGEDINLNMGGKTYFFTEFTGKNTYKLKGLEDLWGIDPNLDRPVYILPFDPSGWTITGVAKAYFIVEFALAYGFTLFMAKQLGEFMSMSSSATAYVSVDLLYFTFTEFPEWYGGEIIHDPAYSAVAAMAAEPPESSSIPEESSEEPEQPSDGVPGFEILSVLLGILPLYALYRKRRH